MLELKTNSNQRWQDLGSNRPGKISNRVLTTVVRTRLSANRPAVYILSFIVQPRNGRSLGRAAAASELSLEVTLVLSACGCCSPCCGWSLWEVRVRGQMLLQPLLGVSRRGPHAPRHPTMKVSKQTKPRQNRTPVISCITGYRSRCSSFQSKSCSCGSAGRGCCSLCFLPGPPLPLRQSSSSSLANIHTHAKVSASPMSSCTSSAINRAAALMAAAMERLMRNALRTSSPFATA